MSYCGATSRSYGAVGRYGDRSERVLEVLRGSVERADALYPKCLRAITDALRLRVTAAGGKVATLAWDDIFSDETGWTVEQRVGKKWKPVRKLPANTTTATVSGSAWRVLARFKGNVSEPSVPVSLQ
jgi:hypothetical protein